MNCEFCNAILTKDEVAITKKMIGRNVERFLCLLCLADYFGCTEDDLKVKIEEFKEQGCNLFI